MAGTNNLTTRNRPPCHQQAPEQAQPAASDSSHTEAGDEEEILQQAYSEFVNWDQTGDNSSLAFQGDHSR